MNLAATARRSCHSNLYAEGVESYQLKAYSLLNSEAFIFLNSVTPEILFVDDLFQSTGVLAKTAIMTFVESV